jgi:predicted lipid carrier protein YhbT
MSTEELLAVRNIMDALNAEVADCATVCLLAAERNDFDTLQQHKSRLRGLQSAIRQVKTMLLGDFREAMKAQVIH